MSQSQTRAIVLFFTHIDISICTLALPYIHRGLYTWIGATGWRRLIECLKLQVICHKRATNYRALLRKMTYEDKAFYDASPPYTQHTWYIGISSQTLAFLHTHWHFFIHIGISCTLAFLHKDWRLLLFRFVAFALSGAPVSSALQTFACILLYPGICTYTLAFSFIHWHFFIHIGISTYRFAFLHIPWRLLVFTFVAFALSGAPVSYALQNWHFYTYTLVFLRIHRYFWLFTVVAFALSVASVSFALQTLAFTLIHWHLYLYIGIPIVRDTGVISMWILCICMHTHTYTHTFTHTFTHTHIHTHSHHQGC